MRRFVCAVTVTSFVALSGCDAPKDDAPPAKTKSIAELQQDTKEMTPEELAKARKEAGIKTRDEVAAENMKEMEKGEREYIKSRLDKYRKLIEDLRAAIDDAEKNAKAWADAKDPQKDFDKFKEAYGESSKELTKRYNEITGNGINGGAAQAKLSKAWRTWENLNGDLAPEISKEPAFEKALTDLRALVDDFSKELDSIEKDDTLRANPNADEEADGGEAAEGGDAAPADEGGEAKKEEEKK